MPRLHVATLALVFFVGSTHFVPSTALADASVSTSEAESEPSDRRQAEFFTDRAGHGFTNFGHFGFASGVMGYLGTAITMMLASRDEGGVLWAGIPVAGPWIALEQGQAVSSESEALLVATGLLQAIGGLLIFAAEVIVESEREQRAPPEVDLGLGPMPGGVFVSLTWRPESGG